MEIKIAENLKRLREKYNVTQRELAQHVNMSYQTVSKWEQGIRMPDIQMIPKLAAFFNVSTDDLLYDKNYRRNTYDKEIKHKYLVLMRNGKTAQARELIMQAYSLSPNSYYIKNRYIYFLIKDGDPKNNKLIEHLAGQLFRDCKDREIINYTITIMVEYYTSLGENQKARDLAYGQADIWNCCERLWCISAEKKYVNVYSAKSLYSAYKLILLTINDLKRIHNDAQMIASYQKYLDILKVTFDNGDYSEFDAVACHVNCDAALCCLRIGDIDRAYSYFKEAAERFERFYQRPHHDFSDDWFNGLDFKTDGSVNLYKGYLSDVFEKSEFDCVRKNANFVFIMDRIAEYLKKDK